MIRTSMTLFEAANIYLAITDNNLGFLFPLPALEIAKGISILADYKNKKGVLKEKEKTIDSFFNPEQGEEKKGRQRRISDINDADWWKN